VHPTLIPTRKFSLPEPPARRDPLKIDVVYPEQGAKRPNVDSNFIFGSVGTGAAELWINGSEIPVAKNGAFLAYLAMPSDGKFSIVAKDSLSKESSEVDVGTHNAHTPKENIPEKRNHLINFSRPILGIVTCGRDTIATGSDGVPAFPEIGADREWMFPRNTHLAVIGREDGHYHIELSKNQFAWIPDSSVTLDSVSPIEDQSIGEIWHNVHDSAWEDFTMQTHHAPFSIEAKEDAIELILYNRTKPAREKLDTRNDPPLLAITWKDSGGNAIAHVQLARKLWGYKVSYNRNGVLTLRIRRPPILDPQEPVRGLTIMLDPGHPPGGTIGPTRLKEEDANLAIALRVRDKLLAKGARVCMTRATGQPIVSLTNQFEELGARVDSAVRSNADLLLSIHNNAFPDGKNPFDGNGTATYYFYPFAAALAESLEREISAVTGVPALGARTRSLALVRPTWMPSVLTESLYMMFPEQEAALRDPVFLDRLAEAHVIGIEDFLKGRLERP
jgi:N-acetylmuramoyl-L-alanine amidase